jgi:hypothetical protein
MAGLGPAIHETAAVPAAGPFAVIASEAKQSPAACAYPERDCFVASLLAMTTLF